MRLPRGKARQTEAPSAEITFGSPSIEWDDESVAAWFERVQDTPEGKCYLCGDWIETLEEFRVRTLDGNWPSGEAFSRVFVYHDVCPYPDED